MWAVMRNKVCSLLGLIAGVYHHLEIPWIRPSWSPFWGTFILPQLQITVLILLFYHPRSYIKKIQSFSIYPVGVRFFGAYLMYPNC